jgi:phosphoglycolate phosphatase
MRLILFDIDGTLIWARGAGHRALVEAMEAVFGTAGPHEAYDWRGKTDPLIVRDLMRLAGVSEDVIRERLGACFTRYVRRLEAILADGHPVDILPGVAALLPRLAACPDVVVGLLTGNVEGGARTKLHPTGLLPFFRIGAFGSDDWDRRRLPAIARERARVLTGHEIPFSATTIIGDTPLDVDCARACGARALGVATGQHSQDELAACSPDLLFADFSEVDAALQALTND